VLPLFTRTLSRLCLHHMFCQTICTISHLYQVIITYDNCQMAQPSSMSFQYSRNRGGEDITGPANNSTNNVQNQRLHVHDSCQSRPQISTWWGRKVPAFRDRGVPGPTSECRRVPQPRWVEREGERKGGRARRPETGVREVGIPRPSCSSRAQVGCTCSRGLQASTRERERAAPSERLSRPCPRAANPL
jgi:hypothetical protein